MVNRRDFIKYTGLAGAGLVLTRNGLMAAPAATGLSDPVLQPKFMNLVPDALSPTFLHRPRGGRDTYEIGLRPSIQQTGLMGARGPLSTPVWGYADKSGTATWPGKTIVAEKGRPVTVRWTNDLVDGMGNYLSHLLPVDTNLHWAYALHGYETNTIANAGVPTIAHLHGGHTDFQYDGNPEFFFNPGATVTGPQWNYVSGGFTNEFVYSNDQVAGTLWYHDHALGITRLNVYAGLAGFYILRDDLDTGKFNNPLGLPAWPYEKAYAIQDRMFTDTGALFYPAFPGDPYYEGFITEEGAILPPDLFPGGGPTALAEFFGDHMVVNGVIWPKEDVEPRNYRTRLLNGTDSRFMAIQLFEVPAGATDFTTVINQLDFTVVGSDQGLASSPTTVNTLVIEPGSRYDLVIDFKQVTPGNRVIMKNIGGDEPFGGTLTTQDPALQIYSDTDKVMAFDVVLPLDPTVPDNTPVGGWPAGIALGPQVGAFTRTRKLGLFEGTDEFGRLQPLLGTAEPAKDYAGNDIEWPNDPVYSDVGLTGPMEGSIAWHSPTTENPALGTTERWDIFNITGDAHPIHLHLVHFEVIERRQINWDSNANDDGFMPLGVTPADNGIYLESQPTVQHNSVAGDLSTYGAGFRIVHPSNPDDAYGPVVTPGPAYVENTPKDMVSALPDEITRIKATFDKPGRYVWHCHILSHEDHEMMRVLHVGPGA